MEAGLKFAGTEVGGLFGGLFIGWFTDKFMHTRRGLCGRDPMPCGECTATVMLVPCMPPYPVGVSMYAGALTPPRCYGLYSAIGVR